MKHLITVILSLLLITTLNSNPADNRLVIFQAHVLNAYYNAEFTEIKRADSFYGYGWLSDSEIFIASQPEGYAEAFAVLQVYNLKTSNMHHLLEIGATGESRFEVHPEERKVIFNDSEGIKLLKIGSNYDYTIENLVECENSYCVFWVNKDSIAYFNYEQNEEEFVITKPEKKSYLTSKRFRDLENKSKSELRLLRNEILARHGQSFKSEDLKLHFGFKFWYKEIPTYKVNGNELTSAETKTLNYIIQLEGKNTK